MQSSPIDWASVEVLSFDCYGTLIDWENGILASLHAVLGAGPGHAAPDDALLEAYARHEARLEAGPWQPYRQVLTEALAATVAERGQSVPASVRTQVGGSVADWPAFDDSVAALALLRKRFGLAVITNCDDDLFDFSDERLGRPFTWRITAQQVGSYKPSKRNFQFALQRIGLSPERIVHVAQSLYHDHVPAQAMGLKTVWVNRRHDRPGFGATPAASARPNLTVPDMATLAAGAVGTPKDTE
ncbi:MAG: haloacid dehalogenase type II [Chloroflexota bacterium]